MDAGRRALSSPTVLVVMGVSGSGKTTVAATLARRLGWDLAEGDALHSPADVAKMAAGQPLTDADRAPWLARVADWIAAQVAAGRSGVITCSALRRSYRDVLRGPGVVFVHLHGPRSVLAARLSGRKGHFMPGALLDSQLATLEPPGPDESAIRVDITEPLDALVDRVVASLDARGGGLQPGHEAGERAVPEREGEGLLGRSALDDDGGRGQ